MSVIKKIFILLAVFVLPYIWAEQIQIIDFAALQNVASADILQKDGSLLFDGEKDYLALANPVKNYNAFGIYMKLSVTSGCLGRSVQELVNSSDSFLESGNSVFSPWGFSVNYDSSGLWVAVKDRDGKVSSCRTNFVFSSGTIYEFYFYIDQQNIRVYLDGKCIGRQKLISGYYIEAKNLYFGAGILQKSYIGMQLYDVAVFSGKQTDAESEHLAIKSAVFSDVKKTFSFNELLSYARNIDEKTASLREIKLNQDSLTFLNPFKTSNAIGVFLKFSMQCSSKELKNTLELFNTADSAPETGASSLWGLSLNYDKRGLWFITRNEKGKNQMLDTGVFFRPNEVYSVFVYLDDCDIFLYVDGKCIYNGANTNGFYKDAAYLHVGGGILVDSYVPMTLFDLKLTNQILEQKHDVDEYVCMLETSETSSFSPVISQRKSKKINEYSVSHPENYILAGAAASYAVSAIALTFLPVCFGIYGYYHTVYEENSSRYLNAKFQSELDFYYQQMQNSAINANAALVAGTVLVPVCVTTLASGIILTIVYHKLKLAQAPQVAFGYFPGEGCILQFSLSL